MSKDKPVNLKLVSDFPDEYIEKLILYKMARDRTYIRFMERCFDKRLFTDERISTMVDLIIRFDTKYQKLPPASAMKQLINRVCEKSGEDPIEHQTIYTDCSIGSSFSNLDEECIKNNILYFVKTRSLHYAIFDNIEDIEKNKDSSKCIERFEAIQSLNFDSDLGLDYFNQLEKHFDYIKNPESKLSTGFRWFDEITYGGFLRDGRCLAIFMAQPGLGKSLMLANLAYKILKQDKVVVVISCEMSQDVYAKRIDSLISDDCIDTLHHTHEQTFSKIVQFKESHPNAKLFIKEYPPRTVKCSDVKHYLDDLINKGVQPDVIIIDYLNLLLPNTGNFEENSYARVLSVSENMRTLTYMYNCPILTATQTNSEGINNAEVGLQHTSESRGTGHTGDFIAALYQTEDDQEIGIINAKILKNRLGGQVGKVHPFKLNPQTLRLEDEVESLSMPLHTPKKSDDKTQQTSTVLPVTPMDELETLIG